MPSTSRALTRAARTRATSTGESYTAAREQLVWIQQLLDDAEFETRAEAEAYVADPANQTMCARCGWTWGMVCPECATGCGCSSSCSGWRHQEFTDDDVERGERNECPECGGDSTNHYECTCYDDEPAGA